MTNSAWYTFGKGTGAGDEQEVSDNQQEGDKGTGTGDDQRGEMPEEMPDSGMGGLASSAATNVGNAAAELAMLVGAGYAVVRR